MSKVALISCVKTKAKLSCKARDFYISSLFKKSLEYTLKNFDIVFILSAKYGLLSLNQVIEPYEKTLNTASIRERKLWSFNVYKQIEKEVGVNNEFYFFCGKNYRQFLMPKLKGVAPLSKLSFGNQLKFYKEQLQK
jgi:hypothetical protein